MNVFFFFFEIPVIIEPLKLFKFFNWIEKSLIETESITTKQKKWKV